jgi:hypothetical protein
LLSLYLFFFIDRWKGANAPFQPIVSLPLDLRATARQVEAGASRTAVR